MMRETTNPGTGRVGLEYLTDWQCLAALAETFPTLAARPHASLDDLREIAGERGNATSVRESARFCLLVWDEAIGARDDDYRFHTATAWAVWDVAHRTAWQAWATAPWFA